MTDHYRFPELDKTGPPQDCNLGYSILLLQWLIEKSNDTSILIHCNKRFKVSNGILRIMVENTRCKTCHERVTQRLDLYSWDIVHTIFSTVLKKTNSKSYNLRSLRLIGKAFYESSLRTGCESVYAQNGDLLSEFLNRVGYNRTVNYIFLYNIKG